MIRRKDKPAQFLACFAGWCKHFRAPAVKLYDEPGANPAREDRCLIRATPDWLEWLRSTPHVEIWGLGIEKHKPLGNTPTHIVGWRGMKAVAAIQIIWHRPPKGPNFLEVDFDLLSPSRGLLPFIGHGMEWSWYRFPLLWGGQKRKTSPFRIARLLRDRGVPVCDTRKRPNVG